MSPLLLVMHSTKKGICKSCEVEGAGMDIVPISRQGTKLDPMLFELSVVLVRRRPGGRMGRGSGERATV